MNYESKNCSIEREEKSCRTCRHYGIVADRVQDSHGTCQRHAPNTRLTTEEISDDLFYAQWPLVRWSNHCGEWAWDANLDEWIDDPEQNPKA